MPCASSDRIAGPAEGPVGEVAGEEVGDDSRGEAVVAVEALVAAAEDAAGVGRPR